MQRHTNIKRQDSEEEIKATDEQLERMLAQQQKDNEELESIKKAHRELEDMMESVKLKSQGTIEEIRRTSISIESNKQNIRKIEMEGNQRQSTMKRISVGSGIFSALGTMSAVAATVLLPPAGVVAAGTVSLEYIARSLGSDRPSVCLVEKWH